MSAVADYFFGIGYGLKSFFERDASEIVRDGFDIGLTALLIYSALLVIRGTRAMQVALGIAFLAVGYVLAKRAGLITVWAMLDSIIPWLVVIIVIIFQTDIRRGLARMGAGGLFSRHRTAAETGILEEVIKAASLLAQRRIGALIVFERATPLDEFIEVGNRIDAPVTKELLYTLFIPSFENPMHDGAVLVRGGRIAEAGVFLPLAGTAGRERTLGARHRAALGITEETDAVAVVVSEERGSISLCFGGNIVRSLDTDHLRDALYGLFYQAPAPKKPKKPEASLRKSVELPPEPSVKEGDA